MNTTMTLYAPTILRLGLAALFLWFGISQITDPAAWTVWVPQWAYTFPGAATLVLVNGWFETIGGALVALGFFTRPAAALLALHLFVIAFEVGYNDIGVRDFALAVSTLALTLSGPGPWSVDERRRGAKKGV